MAGEMELLVGHTFDHGASALQAHLYIAALDGILALRCHKHAEQHAEQKASHLSVATKYVDDWEWYLNCTAKF
jgi:hypothetical protein